MKKSTYLTSLFLLFCFFVNAQSVTDSIKTTVNQMFLAMKNSDGKLLQSCFSDSAILQTIIKNKAGVVSVKNEAVSEFVNQVNSIAKGDADERIQFDLIKIDGDLAIVWTPYQFYYKGKFSHCGVNSFHLVRFTSGWKIQYLIDTRRKNACVE